MLGSNDIIGFVPVASLAEAEQFYGGRLGLTVLGNDGFALVLRAGVQQGKQGNMIRCVAVPGATPAPFTILGWEVPDIALAAANLKAGGVEPKRFGFFEQDHLGVWTAPDGSRVLWFEDPFGNVLSLSQHVAGK